MIVKGNNQIRYTEAEAELRAFIFERIVHLYTRVPRDDLKELVTEVNADEIMFQVQDYAKKNKAQKFKETNNESN